MQEVLAAVVALEAQVFQVVDHSLQVFLQEVSAQVLEVIHQAIKVVLQQVEDTQPLDQEVTLHLPEALQKQQANQHLKAILLPEVLTADQLQFTQQL